MRLEFLTEVYEAVTTDAATITLFGGAPAVPRLVYGMGSRDLPMPYLRYVLNLEDGTEWPVRAGELGFSVYDYGDSKATQRVWALAERLETVVGVRGWMPDAQGRACCRTYEPRSRDMGGTTGNEQVHRVDVLIPVRLLDWKGMDERVARAEAGLG